MFFSKSTDPETMVYTHLQELGTCKHVFVERYFRLNSETLWSLTEDLLFFSVVYWCLANQLNFISHTLFQVSFCLPFAAITQACALNIAARTFQLNWSTAFYLFTSFKEHSKPFCVLLHCASGCKKNMVSSLFRQQTKRKRNFILGLYM